MRQAVHDIYGLSANSPFVRSFLPSFCPFAPFTFILASFSFLLCRSHTLILPSPILELTESQNVRGLASPAPPGKEHNPHDQIPLFFTKVGPFSNPQETYSFYSLPFCKASTNKAELSPGFEGKGGEKHGTGGLGNSMSGVRRESSPYDVTFMDNIPYRQLCEVTLGSEELKQLKEAVHNGYYFEMMIEDLPMWGYLGEIEGEDLLLGESDASHTYLYPHLHFTIGTNQDKIVKASVHTSER